MTKSREIGDSHVLKVYKVLQKLIRCERVIDSNEPAISTAKYILDKFPSIIEIKNKFMFENSDHHHDLHIKNSNGEEYDINLFFTKGNAKIQPKNLGAKSFITKYFLSEDLQEEFNSFLDIEYKTFLINLIEEYDDDQHYLRDTPSLKQQVKVYFPKFDVTINKYRTLFLYHLREKFISILQSSYNNSSTGYINAYNNLLMVNDTNIITRVKSKSVIIEEFISKKIVFDKVKIFKKGNDTVGINYGDISLTLRFKFESSPISSIKLATSFEIYTCTDFEEINQIENNKTILAIENRRFLEEKKSIVRDDSNAVGKCHEAFTYYWFVKKFPRIIQTEKTDCLEYLDKYTPHIQSETLNKIYMCSETTVDEFLNYLNENNTSSYTIENIELVADIYLKDRLNTADLKISIKIHDKYTEKYVSLKAIKNINQKITTKNPGIGTILGEQYFNIGSMSNFVNEVKSEFQLNTIDHSESLIKVSNELGDHLILAHQDNLKRGISNLLGKALMIVASYEKNKCRWVQHEEINSHIEVIKNTPSNSQNLLQWNNGTEEITLRTKFSSGQHHGWSSIKLSAEYLVKFE